MEFTNEQLLEIFEKTMLSQPFNRSIGTVNSYKIYINYLINFLDGKNILDITKKDIKKYMETVSSSDSYYNVNLSAIRTLYKMLAYSPYTEDYVTDVTFGLAMVSKPKKKERLPLSRVEEELVLKGAKNTRDYAIALLIMRCGLRVHELVALTLEQYQNRDEDNMIHLSVTKGSKGRDIWLSQEVVDAIENYLPNRKVSEFNNLFISNGGYPMDRNNMSKTLKVCANRGGVDEDRIGEICNHALRHSAFTDMADRGVNIQTIATLAGHSNLNTTMIYLKVGNEEAKKAMTM